MLMLFDDWNLVSSVKKRYNINGYLSAGLSQLNPENMTFIKLRLLLKLKAMDF